jgi:hypothetical protein
MTNRLALTILALFAAPLGSCSPLALPAGARGVAPQAPSSERPAARAERVVLVTLDGVRWQEMFGGVDPDLAEEAQLPRRAVVPSETLLPNVYRLFFDQGAVVGHPDHGAAFNASGPVFVSLPAYMEMMSGAPSVCLGNDCDEAQTWSLLEEVREQTGVPSGGVAAVASWEKIAQAAVTRPDSVWIDAGRKEGDAAPAWPGSGPYRPDHYTAPRALAYFAAERPRLLWVSLGDADEYAHRGDYRGYLDAIRFADAFLGELAATLDELGEAERTAIYVTTDHGRDGNFRDHGRRASQRVWLLARGAGVAARGPVALSEPRYLRDLAPTVLAHLGLSAPGCDGCGAVLAELSEPPSTGAVVPGRAAAP